MSFKIFLWHFWKLIESRPSFLVVGGESVELMTYGLDTVYYYSPEEDEWQLLARMEYERNRSPSFLVPEWYADCVIDKLVT